MESLNQKAMFEVSSSRARIRLDDVQNMLCKAFWSPDITAMEVKNGMDNSALVVGAYIDDGTQVGFLRVISDRVRFAYVLDVIVDKRYRKQGIGQAMVRFALEHPELKDVYHWLLATSYAHGVYKKCGFEVLRNPEKWMGIINPRPGRMGYDSQPSPACDITTRATHED
jgi:ribosomal protein S18 acetylase RimI-like enzyme